MSITTPSVQADIVADYLHRTGIHIAPGYDLAPGTLAVYSKKLDLIRVAPDGEFKNNEQYYSVLFHELAHSTGHPDRYNRPGVGAKPGGLDYLQEELIAEFTSAFLDDESGIRSTSVDHSNYIGVIIAAIGAGPVTIVWAAERAIAATDAILGRESVAARKLLAA